MEALTLSAHQGRNDTGNIGRMTDISIQANPEISPQLLLAGTERTPVVIIDDFAVDTGDVIRYAINSASFAPDTSTLYPGVRAQPTKGYVQEIIRVISPILEDVYSIPADRGMKFNSFYSLVATQPEQLQGLQRMPHFDSTHEHFFAITHYLNPGEFAGTGLFRHRPTGFENVTEDRFKDFADAANAFIAAHGEPALGYIAKSNDHFELYERIDYRPNRLVAYPGSLLHSGLIDPARDVSSDPATGRLTTNVFMEFR